jgi:glycosyltransferase involved in cell wall biosynthesis
MSTTTRHDRRLHVAIVAPSLGILGGQAVQAQRLLDAWRGDPDVNAWLVPINPVPPAWLAGAHRTKYVRTVLTQLQYWPLLFRELRRADIVHIFSASYTSFILAPLPAVLVSKMLGRPTLVNYRSGEAPDHLRRSRIARATLTAVDGNVVPSQFLENVFAGFGIDATVVPNILDRASFPFRRRDTFRPRLLSTRNLEALYNVTCTLRAFGRIQDRHPDATLTLVGDGAQRAQLERMVGELALRNVTFAGRVPPQEIWRFYDEADIYVQTPDIDNMPSSVLEAFASGLPVVSSDAGGVSTILEHESQGLLVPSNDDVAVAAAVERLIAEPERTRQLVANAFASTAPLAWESVRTQWISLYRRLLAAPSTATAGEMG